MPLAGLSTENMSGKQSFCYLMVGIQNIIRNFEGEELIVSRYSTFIR